VKTQLSSIQGRKILLVVFCSGQARATGHWSRFLTDSLEKERAVFKAFSFQLGHEAGIPEGEYMVFFFEVRMEGTKTEIEFLGLPVDIEAGRVLDTDFTSLPRIMAENGEELDGLPSVDPNDLLNMARDRLETILEERRSSAADDNARFPGPRAF
jgi:hypothetical protein